MSTSVSYRDYHDFLEKEVKSFKGKFKEYIRYLPELFRTLTATLDRPQLEAEERKIVLMALGYFVAPNDVLPESVYGPAGYIDDVFVCASVLDILVKKYGAPFAEPYWEHESESLENFLAHAIRESKEDLGELAEKVLIYTGLGVNV